MTFRIANMVAEWCQVHKFDCQRLESNPCQNCAKRRRPCDVQDGFACIAVQSKSGGRSFKHTLVTCQNRVRVTMERKERGDLTAVLKCLREMSAETGEFSGDSLEC